MHARFFNMFHNARDQNIAICIAKRIHVNFNRVFQETIHQHRAILRERNRFAHVAAHAVFVIHNHHGAATQHIAGAHQHRVSDAFRNFHRFLCTRCRTVGRARDLKIVEQFPEKLAVFSQVDIRGVSPYDGHPEILQRQRQCERRLAPELHDYAVGLFDIDDIEYVLKRQRLEVEAVAGVVVGGNGLRVAIDHDRFHIFRLQGERRMAAAVIKLNTLPDPVWTAPQNHDFPACPRRGFARGFVGGVQIRGEAFKLRRTGIDPVKDSGHAQFLAARTHFKFSGFPCRGNLNVGNPHPLGVQKIGSAGSFQ